ncbi:hypothetical protein I8751_18055 [Nostocaceae cyanobacterium CENA357]|uniref:Uncharacterized protein n=1 Tax=Atlanticothrix silvestris CENA357 TaxID=1725252 RepID=A0A8J7HGB2_9CYAN|nr:hypothetical protein [Atlanticothrix silvestris]MBH8554233.1 hypothetical protein [Atlanticothrix silvestris CENA357]
MVFIWAKAYLLVNLRKVGDRSYGQNLEISSNMVMLLFIVVISNDIRQIIQNSAI